MEKAETARMYTIRQAILMAAEILENVDGILFFDLRRALGTVAFAYTTENLKALRETCCDVQLACCRRMVGFEDKTNGLRGMWDCASQAIGVAQAPLHKIICAAENNPSK